MVYPASVGGRCFSRAARASLSGRVRSNPVCAAVAVRELKADLLRVEMEELALVKMRVSARLTRRRRCSERWDKARVLPYMDLYS
eukprot:6197111-Pleurochrysis_carterae.AAC.1